MPTRAYHDLFTGYSAMRLALGIDHSFVGCRPMNSPTSF